MNKILTTGFLVLSPAIAFCNSPKYSELIELPPMARNHHKQDDQFTHKQIDLLDNSPKYFKMIEPPSMVRNPYKKNDQFTHKQIDSFANRGRNIREALALGNDIVDAEVAFYNQVSPLLKSNIQGIPSEKYKKLLDVAAVAWSLYDDAENQQGASFLRGSFSYIDENSALYNFLLDAVSVLNDGASPDGLTNSYIQGVVPGVGQTHGYKRFSSHYDKKGETEQQFGIDARNDAGNLVSLLPFNHTHLLFGRVKAANGKTKLFLKCEEFGVGDTFSKLMHAFHYATSSHGTEIARREKDVDKKVRQAFRDAILEDMQEDDELLDVVVISLPKGDLPTVASILNEDSFNVGNAYHLLSQHESLRSSLDSALFSEGSPAAQNGLTKETILYRRGNEVVLTPSKTSSGKPPLAHKKSSIVPIEKEKPRSSHWDSAKGKFMSFIKWIS